MSEIIRFINEYALELDTELKRTSLKITKKRTLNIATISANNDKKIGKLVADVYYKVDHVTIEDSPSSETYSQVTNGIKIERGWVSEVMVNSPKTQECVLEDAYILVTDSEIKDINVLVPMLQHIMTENKSILIIGTFAPEALFTLNKNVYENGLKACNIIPPGFGYQKDSLMNDLGIALNATFINEKTGDNLQGLSISDLGLAKKIVVGKDYTVVIRDTDTKKVIKENADGSEYEEHELFLDRIPQHVSDLKEMLKNTNSYIDKKNLNERIANISGGVGVIFVGANSSVEQKEIYDRVEDAVFAVKSANEEGILPGGGIALINSLKAITCDSNDVNKAAAFDILNEALYAPFKQIITNAGVDPIEVGITLSNTPLNGFGYNSKTKEYGMMDEMGIIDATKVTRNALKNSISVAGTIMSTAAVVSNIRE
jgi:chaperonin GroEL